MVRRKNKSKRYLVALILLAMVGIALLIPKLGTVDARTEALLRKSKLKKWVRVIKSFEKEKGSLPRNLYEAANFGYIDEIKVSVSNSTPDNPRVFFDPNLFSEEVEYAFVEHKHGWLILELKEGGFKFRARLMIDQDGRLYKVKEIK